MSSEGGGGHGGNWIVTYADMITLLMAGFIVIVTFGSRESDKAAPRNDSVIGTTSGNGVVGLLRKGPDRDSVVVRRAPMAGNAFDQGSEMPATYSDVPIEVVKSVEASLEADQVGRITDNYDISYPLGLMFEGDELSQAGQSRLRDAARQVRDLPYELLIQVGEPREYLRAVRAYTYLFQVCELSPLRLGVGLLPSAGENGMLVLSFRHRPR